MLIEFTTNGLLRIILSCETALKDRDLNRLPEKYFAFYERWIQEVCEELQTRL